MSTEQILNARIQLRYDTWENWNVSNEETRANGTNADLVLKKGELGICEIATNSNGGAATEKTVLFKVGTYDGINPDTKLAFKELPWASALAADVFSWAKESQLEFSSTGDGSVVTGLEWDSTLNEGKGGIRVITGEPTPRTILSSQVTHDEVLLSDILNNYVLNIDYEELFAFDTSEIVFNSSTTAVLGQAVLGRLILK